MNILLDDGVLRNLVDEDDFSTVCLPKSLNYLLDITYGLKILLL
jgi:hypothetical protein